MSQTRIAEYDATQGALAEAANSPEGNYEQHLTNRVLKTLEKYPNITLAGLKNRLGYVITPVFDLVMEHLVSSGRVSSTPVKFELNVVKGRE
jgi:hypothetical protein